MNVHTKAVSISSADLSCAVDAASRQIPPLWPLTSQVAVNPYLGQAGLRLAETSARLGRLDAGPLTMPRAYYRKRIEDGAVTDADLAEALDASPYAGKPSGLGALKEALEMPRSAPDALPTIADITASECGTDWPAIVADRIGIWAAGYFDSGQAFWPGSSHSGAWRSYRRFAAHDLTPEIMGLAGFAAFVDDAPQSATEAIARATGTLGLSTSALESYFHQLLVSLGGWGQFARYRLWQVELTGDTDSDLVDLLAIRLLWEEALYERHAASIDKDWASVRDAQAVPITPTADDIVDEILQEATERAVQRTLSRQLDSRVHAEAGDRKRPRLQAAFCIDVRSEVFRRALEGIDPSIRTLGFAGFFGMPTGHRRFASDVEELRLPVLLSPTLHSSASGPDVRDDDLAARFRARAKRAWGRFKLAAVSSFAFVEAMGPAYAAKLLRDTFRPSPPSVPDDPKPGLVNNLGLPARAQAAETVLRAMSLTSGFARIVLLTGHGAGVVNNPHASGLQCGACGGYSGEVNAKLLADLLNDTHVRTELVGRGISIPDDTIFVAALHDTTTDAVTVYEKDMDVSAHAEDLGAVRQWLAAAGHHARVERALRLPRAATAGDIPARARNWAEVRPEWGLAGCQAFLAGPRALTSRADLAGRAFLHDYDWKQDSTRGFPVLELIMTAPVVVASWICLQYYGSTVAPGVFGAGNKLLHNVVGGIGVVEGNGGPMRSGLPWQSVHDGEHHSHEPLRLSVFVHAPREALTDILKRHDGVRELFDNRWLHLLVIDEAGQIAWRYAGDLSWTAAEIADEPRESLEAAS